MSDNVIRPKEFRNAPGYRHSDISKDVALSLYSNLFNLQQSATVGSSSSQHLVIDLVQQTRGLPADKTMTLATFLGNNSTMLGQMAECMKEMMKLLVMESVKGMSLTTGICSTMPDDQPPAA